MSPRLALWTLIAASTLVRLAWAASLGPGNDEAYYYLFTVHPDWSYYDHPPLTAWVAGLGLRLGGETSAFAMRLGFVALFAGSTWLMARLTNRLFDDERAGVLAALVLNVSAYFGAAASTFALPDGPLVFFWLMTLDRLAVAVKSPSGTISWVGVGLAWGGALLSKYQAVFLPVGALAYLTIDPSARRWLRRPGPYLAVVVGLTLFAPVLAWNARNGWASFAFQGARAFGSGVRLDALGGALLGQALYLFPWMWAFLAAALVRRFRGGTTSPERFLICQAIPPLAAFLVVACGRDVLPHWSLVGFLAMMPLLGRDWSISGGEGSWRLRRRLAFVATAPPVVMALLASQAAWGWLPIPAEDDPTAVTVGWDQVADELGRRGLIDPARTFLFTSTWYDSGQLSFALRGRSPVLCYSPRDPHGFAHWHDPARQLGRDGILVTIGPSSTEPAMYDRWFERIEPLGGFEVVRAGRTLRGVRLARCVGQSRPFESGTRLTAANR